MTPESDSIYPRLQKEEFKKVSSGSLLDIRKQKILDILRETDEAISTPELKDMLTSENIVVKTTDDVLNICNKLHKDGHIERAKNGITYYWRKID